MHAIEHGMHETGEHPEPVDSIPPEQDMRNMGGLYPKIRTTALTFVAGALALAGFPLTSGFFSKDEILALTFGHGHTLLWAVGLFTAFLTAFYSFRQVFMVFFGRPRTKSVDHAHENPPVMTVPLMVLAGLALVAGLLFGLPLEHGLVQRFLEPVFEAGEAEAVHAPTLMLAVVSSVVAVAGIALAYGTYVTGTLNPEHMAQTLRPLYNLSVNKWYVEDFYRAVIVRPFVRLSHVFWSVIDDGIVDAAVNGVARLVREAGGSMRQLQTGYVRNYALSFLLGVVVIIAWFALR
jgi:NADH-quinone oxidoreductase subunit L